MAKFYEFFKPNEAKVMMDVMHHHDVKFQLKPSDSNKGYIITANIDIDTAFAIGKTYNEYLRITNLNKQENGKSKRK